MRQPKRGPHLVHVDVVEVVFVVDGLEHALQLPRGAAVDHQDVGDSDWVGQHILHGVLVPLNVFVGFAWGKPKRPQWWGEKQQVLGWGARSFSGTVPWGQFEGRSSPTTLRT